mgnify:FL=1
MIFIDFVVVMLAFEEFLHCHAKKPLYNFIVINVTISSHVMYINVKGGSRTNLSRAYKEAYVSEYP